MDCALVTSDTSLAKLCRDVLAAVAGRNWTLSTSDPADSVSPADFYLWDFDPDYSPRPAPNMAARHLYLVDPEALHSFRHVVGNTEANILLKPVTRPILAAYLALAVNSHEECVSSTHSLRADRDEMLQCLIQANLRLQEYDQERTNFLVRAIHDFRASLTALSGYCGLLLSEALGELTSDQSETIRRMQHSTNRLSRMANGMFELGVSRRVQRSPDFRRADFLDCLEQANHEIAPFARDKNITIETDVAPTPSNLYFDTCQIEQVLINLLDNACKFTPRGGSIEIKGYPHFMDRRDSRQVTPTLVERRSRFSNEPNAFRIDIRDSGSRIQPDQLQQIFEEYTSSGGKQDRSGGGLGLAICRFIVEQHGGRIWAENTEAGPLFSFTLPLRSGHHADLESGLANPRGTDNRQ
jgi:signal transduction histidine kinase